MNYKLSIIVFELHLIAEVFNIYWKKLLNNNYWTNLLEYLG